MKRGVLLLAAICLCLLAGSMDAQNLDSGEVFAVPVSDQIVTGTMVLPNGKKVQFGAREGTMVTIEDRISGYFIGFVPKINENSSNKEVTVRAFKIVHRREPQGDFEGAYQILDATKVIAAGARTDVSTEFGTFKLRINEIAEGEFPGTLLDPQSSTPTELKQKYGKSGGGTCCIGCGGITVCGSEVMAECGSCSGGGRRAI